MSGLCLIKITVTVKSRVDWRGKCQGKKGGDNNKNIEKRNLEFHCGAVG